MKIRGSFSDPVIAASHETRGRGPATPGRRRGADSGQRIGVRRYGRIELVPLDHLLYVVGSDKYCELVLETGERRFCDQCLGAMHAALPQSFVRIHKSYVVRFAAVSRLIVKRGARYFAELNTGQRLPVGRSRYAALKSRLLLPHRRR